MQAPNNSSQANGKIKGMMGTTPGKLRLGMFTIFILAICFAIAGYVGVSGARSSVNTIARDAVPSIVTAQTVRVKLLQMDSLASQEFLAGGADSGAQARVVLGDQNAFLHGVTALSTGFRPWSCRGRAACSRA